MLRLLSKRHYQYHTLPVISSLWKRAGTINLEVPFSNLQMLKTEKIDNLLMGTLKLREMK